VEEEMVERLSRICRTMLLCGFIGAATVSMSSCAALPSAVPAGAPASAAPSAGTDETVGGSAGAALEGTGFTQDPCTLLTDAEVSQQLGREVRATPSIDEGLMCEWMPDDRTVLAPVFLEYQRVESRFHLDVIRDLKRTKTGPGSARFDIGNGALLNESRRDISVLVGSSTFRIGGEGPLSDDALVDLARLAQSRVHP
jgi:hypothetical protein